MDTSELPGRPVLGAVFDSSAETTSSANHMRQTVGFQVRQVFVAERAQESQLE